MDRLVRREVGGMALCCGEEGPSTVSEPGDHIKGCNGWGEWVWRDALTLAFDEFQVILPELLISNGRIGGSLVR